MADADSTVRVTLVVGEQELTLGAAGEPCGGPLALLGALLHLRAAADAFGWELRTSPPSPGLAELADLAGVSERLGWPRPAPRCEPADRSG